MELDGESEYGDNAVHRLVLPTHCARSVRLIVPEAGTGRVQSSAVLLHYHASHCNLVMGGSGG